MQLTRHATVFAFGMVALAGMSTIHAQEGAEIEVDVEFLLAAPSVGQVMEMEVTFYEIVWNVEKGENEPSQPQTQFIRVDPANPSPVISASFKLRSNVIYQLMVEGLDADGNPWPETSYYYDGSLFSRTTEPKFSIRPGSANKLQLPVVKGARDNDRGNFLDIFMAADTAQLAVFVQPDLVSTKLYPELKNL